MAHPSKSALAVVDRSVSSCDFRPKMGHNDMAREDRTSTHDYIAYNDDCRAGIEAWPHDIARHRMTSADMSAHMSVRQRTTYSMTARHERWPFEYRTTVARRAHDTTTTSSARRALTVGGGGIYINRWPNILAVNLLKTSRATRYSIPPA